MTFSLSTIGEQENLIVKKYLRLVRTGAEPTLLLLSLSFYFGSTLVYFLFLEANVLLVSMLVVLLFSSFRAVLNSSVEALFVVWLG